MLWDPFNDRVVLVMFRALPGPFETVGTTDTDSVIVPENPRRPVRVIVDMPEEAWETVNAPGVAESEKSAGADITPTVRDIECESPTLVPVIVTV